MRWRRRKKLQIATLELGSPEAFPESLGTLRAETGGRCAPGKGNERFSKSVLEGFRGGAVVENLPANAGDTGSSPGLGRSHMPRSN